MTVLLYMVCGFVMAALIAYGGSSIVYGEYRRGVPSLVAGLALYAAIWFAGP